MSDTYLLSVTRQILHNIHSGGSGRLSVWWALVGNGSTASCLAYKPHECRYSCRGSRFLGRFLSACQFLLSFSGWFSVMVVVDSLRQNCHVVVCFPRSSPTAHSFRMCVAFCLVVGFLWSSPTLPMFFVDKSKKKVEIKRV